MEDKDYLIEEYKTLRQEILQKQIIAVSNFTFAISVSGAILGYALKEKSGFALLAPLTILIPSVYLIFYQFEHQGRIGAYIRREIEPKLEGLSWATSWHGFLESGLWKPKSQLLKIGVVEAVLISIHATQVLCVIASYLYWSDPLLKIIPICVGFFIFLHIFHSIAFAKTAIDYEAHYDRWNDYFESE